MLVLLCLTVSSAWSQEETLLTTIESTGDNAGFTSGSKTFDNIATVTFSGEVWNEDDEYGWTSLDERTLTVTAAEGYTITRVKFYNDKSSAFDEAAPFEAILVYDKGNFITKVNGTSIGKYGVTKIEVYGYANAVATYNVTFKEGTEDATSWQGKAGEGVYQALPLEGVAAGTAVTVKYNGTKKVKSVTVVKKAELLSLTVGDADNYVGGAKTIYYVAGETWGQAIANHPTENAGWIYFDNGTKYPTFTGYTDNATVYDDDDEDLVYDGSVIDGTHTYHFAE